MLESVHISMWGGVSSSSSSLSSSPSSRGGGVGCGCLSGAQGTGTLVQGVWGRMWRGTVQATVITLLLVTHTVLPQHTPQRLPQQHTPVIIEPQESNTFRDTNSAATRYFRYFHLDSSNNHLYIGTLNYVFRLNLATEEFTRSSKLEADAGDIDACKKRAGMNTDFDCKNHVRTIAVTGDNQIYICGTGSYAPREYHLDKDLILVRAGVPNSGIGKCPYDPVDKAACVYVRDGNPGNLQALYSSTVTDLSKENPVIVRPPLSSQDRQQTFEIVRTMPQNTMWLNHPKFIGAFDNGDYVYFFFDEIAIENTVENAVYARVARVCKNDKGGLNTLTKEWTTYLKARLSCLVPGDYPFYFNHLEDVQQIGSNFIGLFTTSRNGLYGSAVCEFTLNEINSAFRGNFKEKKTSWTVTPASSVPTPRPGQCADDSHNLHESVLQFIQSHPIMDEEVTPRTGQPLYYQGNIIFNKLVVDSIGGTPYTVFFLATEDYIIHKVVQWMDGSVSKSHVVSIWALGIEDPIRQMILNNGYLYVGTDHQVSKYPVSQCSQYTLCTDCVRDPYCGWHIWNHKCVDYQTESVKSSLIQGVTTTDPAYKCNTNCRLQTDINYVQVRVPGDPVYLHCKSHCDPNEPIQWVRTGSFSDPRVRIDNQQYFLTDNNALVVFNQTSQQRYECRSGSITLAVHEVQLPDCTDVECLWKSEFRKWCTEFDRYKKEFDQWRCLKTNCLGDDTCMPGVIQGQCPLL